MCRDAWIQVCWVEKTARQGGEGEMDGVGRRTNVKLHPERHEPRSAYDGDHKYTHRNNMVAIDIRDSFYKISVP